MAQRVRVAERVPWGDHRFAVVLIVALTVCASGCGDDSHVAPSEPPDDDRGPGSVERISKTALHAAHAGADKPVPCEGCHDKVGNQFLRAKSDACQNCHTEAPRVLHATVSADQRASECWSCHDFAAREARPVACATCHGEAQGGLPAIVAHDPRKPDEDCGTCHRAHQEPSLAPTACESCHDKEHVTGHDKPGIQITGCASCHGYHEKAPTASGRCTNCHRQSRAPISLHATFKGGHEQCVSCHRPHRFFKAEVIGCRGECHEKQTALSEAKVAEHRGCIGCHDQHDVKGTPRESCVRCHKGLVPRHPRDKKTGTPCVGCHPPHRGPGAPVAAECSSCHDQASSDKAFHQGAAGHGPRCRDCHKPHGFDLAGQGVKLCLGCHGPQPFAGARTIQTTEKHSDCFRCHSDKVAHQPAGPRATCATCHQEQADTVHEKHRRCVGCHDPHTTQQKQPCGGCHKPQASTAHKNHSVCTNCHDPHTTLPKKTCAQCHKEEARTAPLDHQDCRQCHDQHTTAVKRTCASCHTDRATGIHKPVPGGCQACHRPHGPKGPATIPACKSCHQQPLTLLHERPGHAQCTSCHRSHGEQPYRQRATCIACHEDRKDHEPKADLCIGCHLFGGAE